MGSSFGQILKITTFGESHGKGVGVVIDGLPAGLPLDLEALAAQMARRRPGQSKLTTQRQETDEVEILSGFVDGVTSGTPLSLWVANRDQKSRDYKEMEAAYRPSHADLTYDQKYGVRAVAGGGRASARETAARVAAGAVAAQLLRQTHGVDILAWVQQVHTVRARIDPVQITLAQVESHPTRCPDANTAQDMAQAIDLARKQGDSLGGIVGFIARGVPPGLGEPVFNKLKAVLAQALMSLPATMGISFGTGFDSVQYTGHQHNDAIYAKPDGSFGTQTNRAGGMLGGISNGEPIFGQLAFKPTSTINKQQDTATRSGKPTTLQARGRHDPCVVPRAVPIVEAMIALTLADALLLQRARRGFTFQQQT